MSLPPLSGRGYESQLVIDFPPPNSEGGGWSVNRPKDLIADPPDKKRKKGTQGRKLRRRELSGSVSLDQWSSSIDEFAGQWPDVYQDRMVNRTKGRLIGFW